MSRAIKCNRRESIEKTQRNSFSTGDDYYTYSYRYFIQSIQQVMLRIRDGVGLVRIPWLNSDIRTQRVTRFRTESFWEHSHG